MTESTKWGPTRESHIKGALNILGRTEIIRVICMQFAHKRHKDIYGGAECTRQTMSNAMKPNATHRLLASQPASQQQRYKEINDAYERRTLESKCDQMVRFLYFQPFKHDTSFNLFDTNIFRDHCYDHCQKIEYFIQNTT